MTATLVTGLGLVIIAAILWEVFADLFHPADSGALSDRIARSLFSALRGRRFFPVAGPFALLSTIAVWVAGLVVGFALVYVARYPGAFRSSTGAAPSGAEPLLSALYFSFETLITLGYGDVVPQSFVLRLAASIEGLVGFGLLTASVSEIVLLYPALSRMRLLARGVAHIVAAERRTRIAVADSGSDVILASLARDVAHARTDLVHFPILYYFAIGDGDASVARWTRQLCRLAQEGVAEGATERVRVAAAALDAALTDFAALLARRFLSRDSADREAVFAAYAADHAVDRE
jgi:hypothetical protein